MCVCVYVFVRECACVFVWLCVCVLRFRIKSNLSRQKLNSKEIELYATDHLTPMGQERLKKQKFSAT